MVYELELFASQKLKGPKSVGSSSCISLKTEMGIPLYMLLKAHKKWHRGLHCRTPILLHSHNILNLDLMSDVL